MEKVLLLRRRQFGCQNLLRPTITLSFPMIYLDLAKNAVLHCFYTPDNS